MGRVGNWGNQGIEVALKTWLSGGGVLVNHNTWYAHVLEHRAETLASLGRYQVGIPKD